MRHPTKRPHARPSLEQLESRLTPATLVSPTVVTYQDADGDAVTITASRPIFSSPAVANAILTFSAGGVDGSNAAPQQLRKVELAAAALGKGTNLTITAEPAGGGQGLVHVGHIAAVGIDLGKVTVDGDLGRIVAGDSDGSTPGLASLTVGSLGVMGLATQPAGGNLQTDIQGKLGALVVRGDVKEASVFVHGPSGRPQAGVIGSVLVDGDLIGGAGLRSGSVYATGWIGPVTVAGSLLGAGGQVSGSVVSESTTRGIGPVTVGGDLKGGNGNSSGEVFSNGPIGDVSVGGSLLGGVGDGSGRLNANGTIGVVVVGGALTGGAGGSSGGIRASKAVPSIEVTGSVTGSGIQSGGIEVFGKLGSLTIGGDLSGGAGFISGRVAVSGRLGRLEVGGTLRSGAGERSGAVEVGRDLVTAVIGAIEGTAARPVVISAFGERPVVGADTAIGTLRVNGDVEFAAVRAGYGGFTPVPANADASIGTVRVTGNWVASTLVAGGVAAGADGKFGTTDDVLAAGGAASRRARIGSVVIGGAVTGTADSTDHFGFVAEVFGSFSVNGAALALTAGAHNDDLPLGTSGDVRLLEV